MDLQLCEAVAPEAIGDYPDYLAERKLDGVRCYTYKGDLYTRSGTNITARLPEIHAPPAHILDGEIVTADFSFESALRRVQTEDGFKVDLYRDTNPAWLFAFDVLNVNGADVREKPLTERKQLLDQSIPSGSNIVSLAVHDDGGVLWDDAVAKEWEGIILKDPDAPYRGKRSDDWLKVKHWSEDTFPVVGHEYTDNDGFVIYVNIGADEPQKVVVNGRDDQAVVQNGATAATIQYLERTPTGRLRKPSFKGVA